MEAAVSYWNCASEDSFMLCLTWKLSTAPSDECVVCMSNVKTWCFLPCGHKVCSTYAFVLEFFCYCDVSKKYFRLIKLRTWCLLPCGHNGSSIYFPFPSAFCSVFFQKVLCFLPLCWHKICSRCGHKPVSCEAIIIGRICIHPSMIYVIWCICLCIRSTRKPKTIAAV